MTYVCDKYGGECTVTKEFCARRYRTGVYGKVRAVDYAVDCSECVGCKFGISAFKELYGDVNPSVKKASVKSGRKKYTYRKGKTPYSRSYTGGKYVMPL